MTKSAPVMFTADGAARYSTRSATSDGRVKRPVTDWSAAPRATSRGSTPRDCPTVAATPPAPCHSAVSTGPGLTVLTRTPRDPTSLDRALQKLVSAALAAL